MEFSLDNQSSIKIVYDKIIYFDPFKLKESYMDADYIFITHPHYDHFSKEDITKIKKDNTKIICISDIYEEVKSLGFIDDNILLVEVNKDYKIDDISFKTSPAYNIGKDYHKKEYGWVGYIINVCDKDIYFVGDSDYIESMNNIKCDIICIPIGGMYTMDYKDAVKVVKKIKPSIVIPMHYKTVVGSDKDAINLKRELEGEFEVKILM